MSGDANEKAPRGAGLSAGRDAWLSDLRWLNDEAVPFVTGYLAGSLVGEFRDVAGEEASVELVDACLRSAFDAVTGNFNDIFKIRQVAAGHASSLGGFETFCDPAGYRRAAEAAKDRVGNFIKGDREQSESPSSSVVATR